MITYEIFSDFLIVKKKCLIKFYFVLREYNLKESGTQNFFFKFNVFIYIYLYFIKLKYTKIYRKYTYINAQQKYKSICKIYI